MQPVSLFLSSGDLIADRRYENARDLEARGDLSAAADLLQQAVERMPGFASGWFALGELRERLGDAESAKTAFARARALDPDDRHGAALRLAHLGDADTAAAMSPGYVRALFDQYAPHFDQALARLDYRGPQLLRDAVASVMAGQGRTMRFKHVFDLGCGTGLMAEALKGSFGSIMGVDLAPAMIDAARRKGIYSQLVADDMLAFLLRESHATADLVVAADAFVYVHDLAPLCGEIARVLTPDGLLAFTIETHDGQGIVLGEKLRFAHSAGYIRMVAASAGLDLLELAAACTRKENGAPVPGLLAVAQKSSA
jgi:predicted TPR repeat methyltransferase